MRYPLLLLAEQREEQHYKFASLLVPVNVLHTHTGRSARRETQPLLGRTTRRNSWRPDVAYKMQTEGIGATTETNGNNSPSRVCVRTYTYVHTERFLWRPPRGLGDRFGEKQAGLRYG